MSEPTLSSDWNTQVHSIPYFCTGIFMRSRSRKRRSKKSCTSSSLSGPPMFNIKIPVLGFLWKKETFQIPVMYSCFFFNCEIVSLPVSTSFAASYLKFTLMKQMRTTNASSLRKNDHCATQKLTGNVQRKFSQLSL